MCARSLGAPQKGQKCVHLETAEGMWQLLLGTVRPWPLLESWLSFLKTHHNRAISKDTWLQLYDFIKVRARSHGGARKHGPQNCGW